MRAVVMWVVAGIVAGCAHIDHHYATMSFDEFIDEQDLGEDLKDDAQRKGAHRVKWSTGYIYFTESEPDAIQRRFQRWCAQHDGDYRHPLPTVLDGKFVPYVGERPFVPARQIIPGASYVVLLFGTSCVYKNQTYLGGLAIFNDRSVAFYTSK